MTRRLERLRAALVTPLCEGYTDLPASSWCAGWTVRFPRPSCAVWLRLGRLRLHVMRTDSVTAAQWLVQLLDLMLARFFPTRVGRAP